MQKKERDRHKNEMNEIQAVISKEEEGEQEEEEEEERERYFWEEKGINLLEKKKR